MADHRKQDYLSHKIAGKNVLDYRKQMKGMLTGPWAEQYEKTIDAFNDVLRQSETEACEFGFTLAAHLMMDVMQTVELPPIDEA